MKITVHCACELMSPLQQEGTHFVYVLNSLTHSIRHYVST